MNKFFPEIKKNFGFGCMRFPMKDEQVDVAAVTEMVDYFMEAGFNYFDTAKPYHSGASEGVLRQCLTSRYPRESYVLTNKLSPTKFEKEEDIRPLFEEQLRECGVEYFDFYLFHANSAERHKKFTETRAYDIAQELKAEGKIRHVGMSFHDSARVLDKILTDRPEIEAVQLQLNYVDWDDPQVQARKCYDVCKKHGKPVLVMEPVKGGTLVNLPEKAMKELKGVSPANYAIRFAASWPNVAMVLSGMSNMEQMVDNVSFMKEFKPLTYNEEQVIERVRSIYQTMNRIPCTGCKYCVDGCYGKINIPAVFACVNDIREGKEGARERYDALERGADRCIGCDMCSHVCPQGLNIRMLMNEISESFWEHTAKHPTSKTRA